MDRQFISLSHLLLSYVTICGVEYVLRVPLLPQVRLLINVVNKSIAVVGSTKISDHWKEIVLLRYARDLAVHTLFVALLLLGLFLLVFLPSFLMDHLIQSTPSIIGSFTSTKGLLTITGVSGVYVVVRRRIS